ncbi:hypothetical protein Theos_1214 [Thermus oshimai JL-2]|uniref:Outer membrane protein beta-barrel domain-containing protein n=1 Tax=Thermus oshimai JL-2 TaxID=751945 RepID=K7QZG3_THEOS|nr:hypothetical protein Theos_1214 [Thermus oshimai JL-2]
MKRWVMVLCAAIVPSFAQGVLFGELMSASLGLVPNLSVGAVFRAGVTQAVGPLDVRVGVVVSADGGGSLLGVNLDALYPLPVGLQNGRLDVGVGLGFATAAAASQSATDFAFRGLLGYELALQPDLAIRVEPVLEYAFNAQRAYFSVNLGPRVYLR